MRRVELSSVTLASRYQHAALATNIYRDVPVTAISTVLGGNSRLVPEVRVHVQFCLRSISSRPTLVEIRCSQGGGVKIYFECTLTLLPLLHEHAAAAAARARCTITMHDARPARRIRAAPTCGPRGNVAQHERRGGQRAHTCLVPLDGRHLV